MQRAIEACSRRKVRQSSTVCWLLYALNVKDLNRIGRAISLHHFDTNAMDWISLLGKKLATRLMMTLSRAVLLKWWLGIAKTRFHEVSAVCGMDTGVRAVNHVVKV